MNPYPITEDKFRYYITMASSQAAAFVIDTFHALNFFLRTNQLPPLPNYLQKIAPGRKKFGVKSPTRASPLTGDMAKAIYTKMVLEPPNPSKPDIHQATLIILATAGWCRYNDLVNFDLPSTMTSTSKDGKSFQLVFLKRKFHNHLCRLDVNKSNGPLSLWTILNKWVQTFDLNPSISLGNSNVKRHIIFRTIKSKNKSLTVDPSEVMNRTKFMRTLSNGLAYIGITGNTAKRFTSHCSRRGGLSSAKLQDIPSELCQSFGMWSLEQSMHAYDDHLGHRRTMTTATF